MKFIKLKQNKKDVFVNMDLVQVIEPKGAGCILIFDYGNNSKMAVDNSADEMMEGEK